MVARLITILGFLIVISAAKAPVDAQLPIPTTPPDSAQRDTIPVPPFRFDPPVSPITALLRSLLLPGWGQAILDRDATGAFFVMFEGIAWGMTLKSAHQLNYLERIDSEAAEAKRQEFEDWLVLIVFNHLVAGAEAFVGTYLWDFPPELRMQALPGGRVGFGASMILP